MADIHLSGQTIDTLETQASGAAYGDLATPGPSVTLTLTGTIAVVWMSAQAFHPSVAFSGFIGVAVSGASTMSASDAKGAQVSNYQANYALGLSRVVVLTGLTPGVNTFTAKYHNDGGVGDWTFYRRSLAVGILFDPVVIAPTVLPLGVRFDAYSQLLTASGGIGAPYTFTVITGALPGGITLSSAGLLSGLPMLPGVYSFTVRATDGASNTGDQAYTLTIAGKLKRGVGVGVAAAPGVAGPLAAAPAVLAAKQAPSVVSVHLSGAKFMEGVVRAMQS